MSHWIIVPTVLPALVAAFLVLALRHHLRRQRIVSVAASLALVAVALGLYAMAAGGEPLPYLLGNWPAPFGIVLVLDELSATMLLLTSLLGLAVLIYAICGWDARGKHFHALFHFQMLGINGAFLTGDVFNLFVFFEVMLISSYGLMLHGGGAPRLKAGFHYVAINIASSALFLFAVGLIYAVTGTLNMADLAVKAATVAPGDAALLKTGVLLLFMVFATKAALVPVHWWLPATYSGAPAPVAALFMIMTKVGAYAILRVHGMVFGPEAGAAALAVEPIVLPAALVTLVVGTIALLGSRTLRDLAGFAIIASMGTLLVAVGFFDARGTAAALYYLVQSTLAGAALFLLAGVIADRRGHVRDRLVPAPAMAGEPLLAGLFFLIAISIAGLPPLAGFIGKVAILQAASAHDSWPLVWTVILVTSLVITLGLARAGSILFWASRPPAQPPAAAESASWVPIAPIVGLLVLVAGLTVAAGPVMDVLDRTAAQAMDRDAYVRAVLPQQDDVEERSP